MELTEVAIPIRFGGGVDTKTDSKSVAVARLIDLQNAVFDKEGALVKRTGYSALAKALDTASGGTSYTTPKAIAGRGDELVLFADDKLLSYRESSATWSDAGHAHSIVHTERAIAGTSTDQSMPDMATAGGVTVVAWEDSRGGVWWSVVEADTGRIILEPAQASASGQRPRCIACGDRLHVYYADPGGSRIWVIVVNPANVLATGAPSILVGNLSGGNPAFDAEPTVYVTESIGLMAWVDEIAGFWVAYVHPSGVLGSAVTSLPPPAKHDPTGGLIDGPIAVTRQSPWVAVVFAQQASPSAGWYMVTDTDLTVVNPAGFNSGFMVFGGGAGIGTVERITAVFGPSGESQIPFATGETDLWVFCEYRPAATEVTSQVIGKLVATNAFEAAANGLPLRRHSLASRALRIGDTPALIVAHEVPFFPYAALVRYEATDGENPTASAIARLAVGVSDGAPTRQHLSSVPTIATSVCVWPAVTRITVNADPDGAQFSETGIQAVTLDFDHPDAFQTAEWGPLLIVAGALPLRYDGDHVAELGFHTAPEGITIVGAGGGALTPASTYAYAACFEEVDAQGQTHRGPMSIPVLIALGANTKATLTIPTYTLTSKRRVRIGVFRSEANDLPDDFGNVDMYRVTSLDPSAVGDNGYVLNDATVDSVSFTDGIGDLTLLTRERAYTNGGVLSNDAVGLGHIVVAGKDRLFFNAPDDPHLVRFSQSRLDGVGPDIAEGLSLRTTAAGGDLSALAILDLTLLCFKEGAIDYVAGPGPLPNPDAAPQIGFSSAETITSDVGCTAPRSVASTSDRILFKSSRGIYQIDRSRQVAYVGDLVDAYNAQDVVSADPVPERTQILFLTSSGRTLLYDYHHREWSTFTNHEGLDAAVVGGVYHYLRANTADARVFRADSAYLDAGVAFRMYIETAWIKLTGYHQALQKLWWALFLGKYVSSHHLEVKFATDYRPGWGAPYDIDVDADYDPAMYGAGPYGAGPYGGSSDSVYQQRIQINESFHQAIRLAIGEVASPPPQGASFELTELLLTGGVARPSMWMGPGRTQ